MAFWGCAVTETKAAVVDVPEGFVLNVSNATCSTSTDTQVALGLETLQLDGKAWKGAVAHLGAKQPLQVKLDLVFGRKVKFYLAKGSGCVNLTGYFQPGPPADLFEDETPQIETKKNKKRSREEKKSWDEVSSSSSDSEEASEKKVKTKKPETTTPAKKEELKKSKVAETPASTSNPATPTGTSQKKKRKKNKHKKLAPNGEAK